MSKIFRNWCRSVDTSAQVSRIFTVVPKCPLNGHFGTGAEVSIELTLRHQCRNVLGPICINLKCPYTKKSCTDTCKLEAVAI